MQMHDKVPQTLHFSHVGHCLAAIREDIICNADDTPRYTGFANSPSSGLGQIRMCRDWSELEKWAREHSACYRAGLGNGPWVELERFNTVLIGVGRGSEDGSISGTAVTMTLSAYTCKQRERVKCTHF